MEHLGLYHRRHRSLVDGLVPLGDQGLRREGVESFSSASSTETRVRSAESSSRAKLHFKSYGAAFSYRPLSHVRHHHLRHHWLGAVFRLVGFIVCLFVCLFD